MRVSALMHGNKPIKPWQLCHGVAF